MAGMESEQSTPTGAAPNSPSMDILTPRVDALREKLAQDRMASSARKERKKSLEGCGDARSTIEGMLTARKTARKASLDSFTTNPPDWFTSFKQGMEARVNDLENQLEEKTDEVQQLRERVESLEDRIEGGAVVARSEDSEDTKDTSADAESASIEKEKVSLVPKLSLGAPAAPVQTPDSPDTKKDSPKKENKIGTPNAGKPRAAVAGTKDSPKTGMEKKEDARPKTMAEKKAEAEKKKKKRFG